MSHSHVMWGTLTREWRCLKMRPESKGCAEIWGGAIGPLPIQEDGTQPCWKLQPAASLGLAQSWGHSGDLPRGVIFLRKTNFRPIWVSRPLQRGPHPTFSSSLPAPAYLTSLTCSHSPAVSSWSEFCFTFQVNHNCLVDSTDSYSGSQLPARRWEAMHG